MIGKPSSPALLGIAVLSALVLAACSNGTHLHFVAITPAQGTVFFSGTAAGVKGAAAQGGDFAAGSRQRLLRPAEVHGHRFFQRRQQRG